jgi:hypothetical protein
MEVSEMIAHAREIGSIIVGVSEEDRGEVFDYSGVGGENNGMVVVIAIMLYLL